MPQPKISIIIPVYNTEKYLRECLDSVLSQTLQNIEIIVVNDVSPDKSQSIIDEYVAKDTRIQCIVHPENLGLGGARNTGIATARAEYIAFVDSDDWIDQHCYATVIEEMEATGANLGVFSVENFDERGHVWFEPHFDFPYSSAQKVTAQNINKIPATMCGKVFRCEDVQQNILRLPVDLKHEDEEFCFKYASWHRPLVIGISEALYHYRQHSASITANNKTHHKDYPQILQNIADYLEKAQLYSEYRSAFGGKIVQSLECYENLFVEYREQYCCDMRHLFEQCHLSIADILNLDPRLALYYIEDELLRQHFLQLQKDHQQIQQVQQDRQKLQQNCQKLQQDRHQVQQDRWYRFGQLSRKRKLWTLARDLSKRFGIYRLLRPLAQKIKSLLRKTK